MVTPLFWRLTSQEFRFTIQIPFYSAVTDISGLSKYKYKSVGPELCGTYKHLLKILLRAWSINYKQAND